MNRDLLKRLENFPGCEVRRGVPLSALTTFRVGGPADILICPDGTETLSALLRCLREEGETYVLIGRGSNLVFSDEGCRVPVVSTANLTGITLLPGCRVRAEAGVTLRGTAVFAMENGLTGLEFVHGIPGTLGGGIVMNAGAYGGTMADVTVSVEMLDKGAETMYTGEEMDFGYRHSRAQNGGTVLAATLKLREGDPDQIRARMRELQEKRRVSQPLEYPSAGSFFKRPEGHYAGALIDQAGLKGFRIGGAMVSEKHAGFVINAGGATFADIMAIKEHIREAVFASSGVTLETEVIFIDARGRRL